MLSPGHLNVFPNAKTYDTLFAVCCPLIHRRLFTVECSPGRGSPAGCRYLNWIYDSASCSTTNPRSILLRGSSCSKSVPHVHLQDILSAGVVPGWCASTTSNATYWWPFAGKSFRTCIPQRQPWFRRKRSVGNASFTPGPRDVDGDPCLN